ncbi:hypothetical protein M0220_13450 [Halomonas qinghailakensis]|uniref:Uncharacterized protein n=1 Tax=Halomonas qinghailakensis TaxID=2937790 RepID=A0AA46TPJ5_9GAMM|nr:hypothetical protein [Halomonas sp. ZZQ-149]UYO73874.1 hypothetical protein M0220_13450 [Halomonas sp. ZZQ-149]
MSMILHIGAGQASELPQWRKSGATRIVLVEPNPMLAQQLRHKAADDATLTIVEAAVTPSSANTQLYEYNLPEANSLRPATGLKSLFPGLKTTATHSVATLTPTQLLADYGPAQGERAQLVLQTPGEEGAILKELIETGQLNQFQQLHLYANPEPYYQGSIAAKDILQQLAEAGFDITDVNQQDPDWPHWQLTRHPLKDQLLSLQEETAALKQQLQERQQQLETNQQQSKKHQQKAEEAAQQAQAQLKEKTDQLARLHPQFKQQQEEVAALKQQLQERQQQLEASQQQSKKHQQKAEETAEQAQAQLKEKTDQLAQLHTQLKQQQEEVAALKQQLQERQQQLEASQQQSKKHQQKAEEAAQQAQAQLKEKANQLAEAHAQCQQLKEETETLQIQLNQAQKASQQHQQTQSETAKQLKQAQQQQANTQQTLAATESKLKQVEEQRQAEKTAHQELQHKFEETHGWFVGRKQQAEERAEKLKSLQNELAVKAEQAASLEEKLKASEEEREKYINYFANRKKQHEESQAQLTEAQQTLKEKDITIRQLSEQLTTLQQSNERFGQLESKLESLFGEQRSYIQQTTNALGQHVTRSARQQRDEHALTHYLQHGQRPVSTQLPPGYAVALLEHYDATQHDAVVVLGSAHTTELMAQGMFNIRSQAPRLQSSPHESTENEVTLSHADLPQAIVSIEHQNAASEALKQRLHNKGTARAVNTVYAPWVECQANGQTALFYAVEPTLQRLNQWLSENGRVLVIVGEDLPQAGHSREIALALLLQQLPTQRLDMVLEGNQHPQETSLKESWDKLLETRQRPCQWLTLPNAYSLRVEG